MENGMGTFPRFVLVALALLSFSLTPTRAPAADVTDDRLLNAGSAAANWPIYNRTYNGSRYSPPAQLTTGNIKRPAPTWISAGGARGEQQTTASATHGRTGTT